MFKRYLALFALATMVLGASQASALEFDEMSYYAQGAVQLPIGDWGDYVSLGFGPGFGVHVPHSDELSFRGEVSYFFFSTDDEFFGADSDVSVSSLPILALAQYSLEDNPIYLLGGIGFNLLSVEIEYDTGFGRFSAEDSSTELNLVAGAGFMASENLAIEARFNVVSDANSLQAGGVLHF